MNGVNKSFAKYNIKIKYTVKKDISKDRKK